MQIGVEGFDAQSAHLIASMIVKESERFINEISHRAAREQMAFAEKELSLPQGSVFSNGGYEATEAYFKILRDSYGWQEA